MGDNTGQRELEDWSGHSADSAAYDTIADRTELGRLTLGALHGETGLHYVARLAEVCPDMADLLLGFAYGSVYARPGLDIRSRQIATIAALTALGDSEHELSIHIASSLRAGLTREEIVEVILQMSVYAGFPRALSALKSASAAFEREQRRPNPDGREEP